MRSQRVKDSKDRESAHDVLLAVHVRLNARVDSIAKLSRPDDIDAIQCPHALARVWLVLIRNLRYGDTVHPEDMCRSCLPELLGHRDDGNEAHVGGKGQRLTVRELHLQDKVSPPRMTYRPPLRLLDNRCAVKGVSLAFMMS